VPHDQHRDRVRHQLAVKIHAGDAHMAERMEDPAACHRARDAEDDVQQQAFAGLVNDLAGDQSRPVAQNDPSQEWSSGMLLVRMRRPGGR
jgi:hypothetical protein